MWHSVVSPCASLRPDSSGPLSQDAQGNWLCTSGPFALDQVTCDVHVMQMLVFRRANGMRSTSLMEEHMIVTRRNMPSPVESASFRSASLDLPFVRHAANDRLPRIASRSKSAHPALSRLLASRACCSAASPDRSFRRAAEKTGMVKSSLRDQTSVGSSYIWTFRKIINGHWFDLTAIAIFQSTKPPSGTGHRVSQRSQSVAEPSSTHIFYNNAQLVRFRLHKRAERVERLSTEARLLHRPSRIGRGPFL